MHFQRVAYDGIALRRYPPPAQNLDQTISLIGDDIMSRLKFKSILCVMDFSTPSADLSEYLREGITSALLESSSFKIVSRKEIDKIQKELDFQASGYVSDESAISICKRLGAQYILVGDLRELNNAYNLRVKLLGVETAEYVMYKTYSIKRSMETEQLLGNASTYKKCDLGLMAEANKNSVSAISPGVGISFAYNVTKKITAGINVILSYDFAFKEKSIFSLEPLAFFRFYAVSPTGEPCSGMFIQADVGAEIIFVGNDSNCVFDGGGAICYKKNFNSFYIEGYLRGGYPYIFGGGIGLGMSF